MHQILDIALLPALQPPKPVRGRKKPAVVPTVQPPAVPPA
jgi:hypothetical protein